LDAVLPSLAIAGGNVHVCYATVVAYDVDDGLVDFVVADDTSSVGGLAVGDSAVVASAVVASAGVASAVVDSDSAVVAPSDAPSLDAPSLVAVVEE